MQSTGGAQNEYKVVVVEDDEIVKRTLARRINVRVTKLDDLIREMASN